MSELLGRRSVLGLLGVGVGLGAGLGAGFSCREECAVTGVEGAGYAMESGSFACGNHTGDECLACGLRKSPGAGREAARFVDEGISAGGTGRRAGGADYE